MSQNKGKKTSVRTRAGRTLPAFFFALAPLKALKNDPIIKEAYGLRGAGSGLYLVGGAVRNAILCKPVPADYDFVTGAQAEAVSKSLASRLAGYSFLLDKKTRSFRVAATLSGEPVTIDFSPIKDNDIISDLKARDFTVNAMAVSVPDLFEKNKTAVLDPCGGIADARAGLLRMTGPGVFDEDPLRCLRALRLSQQYGLRITGDTAALIKAKSGLLQRTSSERIRDEFVLIFSSPGTSDSIRALYELGIIDATLPWLAPWKDVDGYDLLTHSLKTLDEAEKLIQGAGGLIGINEEKFPGLTEKLLEHFKRPIGAAGRAAFFKICAFLHDAGKPLTKAVRDGFVRFIGHDYEGSVLVGDILKKLRFSRKAAKEITNLVKNHHRVFALAKLKERSLRAKAHLFRAVGGEAAVDLLMLSLADARATRGGEDEELFKLVRELLDFYYTVYTRKKPKPILNGTEIMKTFHVPQGPLVGGIIHKISEGVEAGAVRNRKEAVLYVRKWLKEQKGPV